MEAHFIIFILLLIIPSVSSIPINNGVIGTPQVSCAPNAIQIAFRTQQPFLGRVYIKGFADNPQCVVKGAGDSAQAAMALSFDNCGVTRARQSNPPGISVTSIVIISFHPTFLTKVDRAYRINCFYMEASKAVTNALEVSMLTTQNLDQIPEMPVCRYEILDGSANGLPIKYARIGQPVYHKWTCESGNQMFCMRVHSCAVSDGQGSPSVDVIDARGCGVDRYVLRNPEYLTDLVAGQEAHVFKFADKPALFFNCQIEISLKDGSAGCETVRPQCPEPSGANAIPRSSTGGGGVRGPLTNFGGGSGNGFSGTGGGSNFAPGGNFGGTGGGSNFPPVNPPPGFPGPPPGFPAPPPGPAPATFPQNRNFFRGFTQFGRNRRSYRSVEMPELKESFDLPPRRLVVFDLDDTQEGDVQIPIDQEKHDNNDAENQNHNRKQTENLQRQAQEELLDRIIPYDRSMCLNSAGFATVVTVILLLIIMTLFGLVYVATKKRRETSVSRKVERIDG